MTVPLGFKAESTVAFLPMSPSLPVVAGWWWAAIVLSIAIAKKATMITQIMTI
jgi:hypothetical protein